jgi:hypothetical protein
MNLTKRKLAYLTAATAIFVVTGMNLLGPLGAKTTAQNSPADVGDTMEAKIARAMSAGPTEVASSARIVDTDPQGNTVVLREGNNGFTCMPAIQKRLGNRPCV